jgi:hypothetical protein
MGLGVIKFDGKNLVNKITSSQYIVEVRCFDSLLFAGLRTIRCKEMGKPQVPQLVLLSGKLLLSFFDLFSRL